MIRLFVAIPLPETVRMQLSMLQAGLPGARWIRPENLHLTLRFIGEVPEDLASDIDAALSGLRAPGFPVRLDGIGDFSRGRHPHSLWVGAVKAEPLMRLQGKIESALVRTGLRPEERKFMPHVTLARLKEVKRHRVEAWAAEHGAFQSTPFDADRFVLFSSFLSSDGAIYTPEREYRLDG